MSLVGRLEDLALPDIFQIISLSKKTGTLIVRSRRGTGMVVFKDGQVVQAASDGIRDSLGNILVSQGLLDEQGLSDGLARQKKDPNKPLGMILSESGVLPAETLEGIIRKQIEEIVYDLLAWEEGFFNFELGEIAPKDKIEIDTQEFLLKSGISAEYLLMEGTRILDEKRKDEPRQAPKAPPPAAHASYEPAVEEFRTRIETEEPRKEITALKSMFDELRFPTATAEVTLLILRYASEVVNRAILFMVKKDEVRGLGQFGIELKGKSPDQVVRNIRVPLDAPSLFASVIEMRHSYLGPLEQNESNTYVIGELGGAMPDSVMAIPLIVDGKVALVVYGDNLPDQKPIGGVETLEIFMSQAGIALEKALLERKLAELQKERE
ncbi:MAG TPA: diguanylate cyclase [Nitrospiraceae bacterium]|nr:diguanylate cyclase [Nitrospiraceae bacterium]